MQHLFSAKPVLAIALVLGGLAAASGAHAAQVSVVVQGGPTRHVQPAPVVVQPAPVYVQPGPVHAQPRVVQAPVRERGPWGDADHDGVPNRYDRYDQRHDHRYEHRDDRRYASARGPWGDADRDGVPNRYDRAPYNPYRR